MGAQAQQVGLPCLWAFGPFQMSQPVSNTMYPQHMEEKQATFLRCTR